MMTSAMRTNAHITLEKCDQGKFLSVIAEEPSGSLWRFLPLCSGCADEELGPVSVWASIGHGQNPGPCMLQDEVLIFKLVAVDGFSTGSIVVGEVTSLGSRSSRSESHQ